MDKVLRREPQENAFVEINNLLACVPILKLDRETINNCLQKYEVSLDKARSRLLNLYSVILRHFLQNTTLDNTELERLHHLKHIFSLEDQEIGLIHKNIAQPIYKMHVRRVVSNGSLTEADKASLKKIAENLYIPIEFAKKLYINEASHYLHSVLERSIANGMLSNAEEEELHQTAKKLQVELKFSQTASKNLERCRNLWKLYQGELPRVKAPVQLRQGEICSAFVAAIHYDVSNPKVPVTYSGYHELKGQNGIGYHSGMFRNNEVIGKVIRFIDQGTLYLTDRRILFNGTNGKKYFLYHNLMGGTFYQNGLLIEQKRGRDQFFKFTNTDLEAIKLIFDSLMTKSRN